MKSSGTAELHFLSITFSEAVKDLRSDDVILDGFTLVGSPVIQSITASFELSLIAVDSTTATVQLGTGYTDLAGNNASAVSQILLCFEYSNLDSDW